MIINGSLKVCRRTLRKGEYRTNHESAIKRVKPKETITWMSNGE